MRVLACMRTLVGLEHNLQDCRLHSQRLLDLSDSSIKKASIANWSMIDPSELPLLSTRLMHVVTTASQWGRQVKLYLPLLFRCIPLKPCLSLQDKAIVIMDCNHTRQHMLQVKLISIWHLLSRLLMQQRQLEAALQLCRNQAVCKAQASDTAWPCLIQAAHKGRCRSHIGLQRLGSPCRTAWCNPAPPSETPVKKPKRLSEDWWSMYPESADMMDV